MERYIALLRGINISGKNKISMSDLKDALIDYSDVNTYLNSGNIIFSAKETDPDFLAEQIHAVIKDEFNMDVPVVVLTQFSLKALLNLAPEWWGTDNKEIYDNLIFAIPPNNIESVADRIGAPSKGLEQICICGNCVFWSFDRKKYAKANWWKKSASPGIGEMITIRTANTIKKIVEM